MKTLPLLCLLSVSLFSSSAMSDTWPTRPIRLIVPFAPGGTTDIVARTVADRLGRELGQPVVVENRAGAAGAIGSEAVARAAPDGYTIGMATVTTHAVNPAVFPKLSYNVQRDLVAVTKLVSVPNVMTIGPNVKASDMAHFVSLAKEPSSKLSYGSSGLGAENNLMGELFNQSAGVKLMHVPYRGAGPALQDAMAGQIDAVFDNLPSSLPFIQGGKMRALAIASPKRLAMLPNVPTFAEVGLPAVNDSSWFGLVAPAKTPTAIVERIQSACVKVLAMAETRSAIAQFGGEAVGNKPQEFSAELDAEIKRFRTIADAKGIKLE